MKLIRAVLGLSLLALAAPCLATITAAQGNTGGGGPAIVAFSSSVASGTVIVAQVTGNSCENVTVTDSINSGDYTLSNYAADYKNCWFYIIANATGTPTVTAAQGGSYYILSIAQLTGFSGTPTVDTTFTNSFTGTSTSIDGSAVTGHSTEILMAGPYLSSSYFTANPTGGWTALPGQSAQASGQGVYIYEASSGSTGTYAGPLAASAPWDLQIFGIYDASGGGGSTPVNGGFALSPSN